MTQDSSVRSRRSRKIKRSSDHALVVDLANDLIDVIKQPRKGVDTRHAMIAAHLALQQVWKARGGTEAGLLAFVAEQLNDPPALYYGPRSRLRH